MIEELIVGGAVEAPKRGSGPSPGLLQVNST